MAKYTVTYKCGHEGQVQLFGKAAEREQRIEWYETSALCPECFRGQTEQKRLAASQQAAQWANAEGLPNLVGTTDQILWAESIRYDRISAVREYVQQIAAQDVDDEQRLAKMVAALEEAVVWLGQQTGAKWWIDRRDSLANELLMESPAIADALAAHSPVFAASRQLARECELAAAAAAKEEREKRERLRVKKEALAMRVRDVLGDHVTLKVWDRDGDRRVYITRWKDDIGDEIIAYYHTGKGRIKPGTIANGVGVKVCAAHCKCDDAKATSLVRDLCEFACKEWTSVQVSS